MRFGLIAFLVLALSSCGKAPAQESAALSTAILCRDNLACAQWCHAQYHPKITENSWTTVSTSGHATCPSSANVSACFSLGIGSQPFQDCLTQASCVLQPTQQAADDAVAEDVAQNCLNLPKDQVLP